jgi:hypothetical protein
MRWKNSEHPFRDEETAPLPSELAALQNELTARGRPEVPPGLRSRVLAVAHDELARNRTNRPRARWRVAAGIAAAALLCANLALSLEARSTAHLAKTIDGARAAALSEKITRLNPDISEVEAHQVALLAQGAPHFVPAPAARVSPATAFEILRGEEWDTH